MAFLLLPALAFGHLHSVDRRRLVVADSVDAEDPRGVADLRQHRLRLQARRVHVRVHSLEEVVLGVVLVKGLERVHAALRLLLYASEILTVLLLQARKLCLKLLHTALQAARAGNGESGENSDAFEGHGLCLLVDGWIGCW